MFVVVFWARWLYVGCFGWCLIGVFGVVLLLVWLMDCLVCAVCCLLVWVVWVCSFGLLFVGWVWVVWFRLVFDVLVVMLVCIVYYYVCFITRFLIGALLVVCCFC